MSIDQLKSKFFKYKRYLDNPTVMLSIIFSGIILFALLLFFESFGKNAGVGTEIIGSVSFISNSVRKKVNTSVVWSNLNYQMPLYRFDTIRTETESTTLLALIDETEIRLDENSMVMLDIKDKIQKLELLGGNIQVNKKSAETLLEIRAGDLKIDISREGEYNIKINKDKKVELYVNTGEATVNRNTFTYTIKEAFLSFFKRNDTEKNNSGGNSQANLSENKSIPEEPFIASSYSVLKTPENLKFVLTKKDTVDISFFWSAKEEANRVQFSFKNDFSTIYKEIITKENKMTIGFPIGSYYWRVIPLNPNTKFETEVKKFIILSDAEFRLRFPEKDAVIVLKEKSVYVNFAWDSVKDIKNYTLQLSRNNGLEPIDLSVESQSNILSLEIAKEGEYFYRVKAEHKNPDFPEKYSDIGKFTIVKETESKLELLNPGKFYKTSPANKVLFGWQDNKTYQNYTLIIAENPEFTNGIKKFPTKNNYSIQNIFQEEKDYYWKVEGLKRDGNVQDSETRILSTKVNSVPLETESKTSAPVEPKKVESPVNTSTRINAPKSKVNTETKYEEDDQ